MSRMAGKIKTLIIHKVHFKEAEIWSQETLAMSMGAKILDVNSKLIYSGTSS